MDNSGKKTRDKMNDNGSELTIEIKRDESFEKNSRVEADKGRSIAKIALVVENEDNDEKIVIGEDRRAELKRINTQRTNPMQRTEDYQRSTEIYINIEIDLRSKRIKDPIEKKPRSCMRRLDKKSREIKNNLKANKTAEP
ncbi:3307_t:CDS:2 [Scutellospora calospora]|uniref:3307_t:CDS:1 n=1 Tax=Scutellospora calospora TaxID=85575 RepID=A0ACA9JXH3_9GLOM|nr:3307_t:CDS:2 [Scutellospora calospora]